MQIIVGESFYPLLNDKKPYEVLIGGAGSGKSEFCGGKVFYRCETEGRHNFWILRKVNRTLKDSVIPLMISVLEKNNVQFSFNKTDQHIDFFNANGQRNRLNFTGLDNREKIKSIKGVTGFWLEEATEFSLLDFTQLDLRLREPTGHYHQIMLSLNPDEAAAPWIKNIFDDRQNEYAEYWRNATVHHSTVLDNPIKAVRDSYIKKLDRINDKTYRDIYRFGLWATYKGVIYDWDVQDLPPGGEHWFDEIFYGGDFGFSVDPAAFIKIYRKADEYWLQELIYETGLTNIQLGKRILSLGVPPNSPQYWDSSEPKSIQELYDMGLNANPAAKGPDSIKAGIDFCKQQKIHIVTGSDNIVMERNRYKFAEDKDGNLLFTPVDAFNHAMDASRYAIHTHRNRNYAPPPVSGERGTGIFKEF